MQTIRVAVGVLAVATLGATAFAQTDPPVGSAAAAKAEIGKPPPDFQLSGADGKTYKLSDYKDKVLVLEWYNQGCPVCNGAMPKMKDAARKYAKQGVAWLAIDSGTNNTPESNARWMTEQDLPYPVLTDADGRVGKAYGAKTTPHMVVINKGTVVYIGAHDNRHGRDYVPEALDAILAGKPVPSPRTAAYGCSIKYKK